MNLGYLYVITTIFFTCYGQVVIKWQVDDLGEAPADTGAKITFLLKFLINPWVISVLIGAAIAAFAWMAALSKFELSRVYPFMSLSFVVVLIASALFFDEPLSVAKVVGILLIFAGLAVGSQ